MRRRTSSRVLSPLDLRNAMERQREAPLTMS